ncbi:MAG: hypothetical protein FJZ61_03380 [Chlamydiae bacterium]|nr:hypothetical protein [Chlamydiota bacterium]
MLKFSTIQSNVLTLLMLGACGSAQNPRNTPCSATKKEMVSLNHPGPGPYLEEPRYIGGDTEFLFGESLPLGYWDIPKEAFSCRGSKKNTPRKTGNRILEDCGGIHDATDSIALELAQFLNRFQAHYQKRLKVLIGYRCKQHQDYIEASDSFEQKDRVVVRLEGVDRDALKKQMEKILRPKEGVEISFTGFSIEDADLWGESQTVMVRWRKEAS